MATHYLPSGSRVRLSGHYRFWLILDRPGRRPVVLARSGDAGRLQHRAEEVEHAIVLDAAGVPRVWQPGRIGWKIYTAEPRRS